MNDKGQLSEQRSKKGGNIIPALCNILGTLIMIIVIILCLPMVIPRFTNIELYNVVSGSMEPEIPVGSVVVVKEDDPGEIVPDDIIAFYSGNSVITHRVVENHKIEGEFVTKGDANEKEDLENTSYSLYIGKVIFHAPMLGDVMTALTSMVGKMYMLAFLICGLLFNILASRIRANRRSNMVSEEIKRMQKHE